MKLVSRIKKIQDDISSIKDQCRELLAAKQVYFFLSLSLGAAEKLVERNTNTKTIGDII